MYAELKLKICPQCKLAKEKKEFGKDSTTSSGVSSWCKPCKKTWRAKKREDEPDRHKAIDFENDLKKNYGINTHQYNKMFDEQKGCCACCGRSHTDFKRGLHVDHNHTTGQVRGLLCTKCNPGIGYFDESTEKLEMAIAYLNKFKK